MRKCQRGAVALSCDQLLTQRVCGMKCLQVGLSVARLMRTVLARAATAVLREDQSNARSL